MMSAWWYLQWKIRGEERSFWVERMSRTFMVLRRIYSKTYFLKKETAQVWAGSDIRYYRNFTTDFIRGINLPTYLMPLSGLIWPMLVSGTSPSLPGTTAVFWTENALLKVPDTVPYLNCTLMTTCTMIRHTRHAPININGFLPFSGIGVLQSCTCSVLYNFISHLYQFYIAYIQLMHSVWWRSSQPAVHTFWIHLNHLIHIYLHWHIAIHQVASIQITTFYSGILLYLGSI